MNSKFIQYTRLKLHNLQNEYWKYLVVGFHFNPNIELLQILINKFVSLSNIAKKEKQKIATHNMLEIM